MVADGRELDWPHESRCYLTLDLECDYGTGLSANRYEALRSVDSLADLLAAADVPLTCFVQTEVLDVAPEVVERLRDRLTVTFHPHTHTHPRRSAADMTAEIARSTDRFRSFFGTRPAGYRLPDGDVRISDQRALAEHGYAFDASLLPTWRPGRFDNRDAPIRPHVIPDLDLIEIPFTVYSESVRIPTALSSCRLLGRPFTWLLVRRPPPVVVFNVHMHDLVRPSGYRELPWRYRAVYGRNGDGIDLLERIIDALGSRGYAFETIDTLHEELRARECTYSR